MASKELFHLLRVLDERDSGLRRDDVAWAFESANSRLETESWVRQYLTPVTLLSKEEHAFVSSQGSNQTRNESSTTSRPLTDEDFEHAIKSLESSTAAIEKQCQLMEAQKLALQDIKAQNASQDKDQAAADRTKKLTRDKAQLDFELNNTASALQSQLRASMKRTEGSSTSLPLIVERVLEKDDRLLDGLQKIVPKIQGENSDTEVVAEVEKLCHAFTVLEGRAIRSQIDATYRSHLHHSSQPNGHKQNRISEQQDAAHAELDELSSEIDGLLALVSENYFHVPIVRGLTAASSEAQAESVRWSQYLRDMLVYLTSRLESLDEHFRHVQTHRAALTSLSQALEHVLATPTTARSESKNAAAGTRAAVKGLKPLRLVQANLSESGDPVAQLLRQLDIGHNSSSDSAALAQLLAKTREERESNSSTLSRTTEGAITKQLSESFAKADGDLRDLLGAVYAHSVFGSRKLVDGGVQAGIDGLAERTGELGEKMRSLDLESLGSEVRKTQREILDRKS